MRKINVNIFPPDGRFYKDADGTIFRAESWNGVIKKVEDYRRRNNMPMGNAEEEVIAQACQRNPNLCSEATGRQKVPPKGLSLKDRALRWLSEWLKRKKSGQPVSFVREEDARNRARVCAPCMKNQAMGNGCSACKQAFKGMREEVTEGRKLIDERLGGCDALGIELKTAIWLDEPAVPNDQLPAHCWRKRTL